MPSKFRLSSEPVIFLYTIIFTVNYTVLPQLVLKKVCLQKYNASTCVDSFNQSDVIQKEASTWWFYLLACSLAPSLFTVLIWGPISDVIGRKRAILIVPFVNGVRAIVYLVNVYYVNASPGYLMFGSFLSCFYGEFQGVVALCYAYMADITQGEQRTMRMAVIEGSLFFAGVPAGLLSGYLLQSIGYMSVFMLTLAINVLIFMYAAVYLSNDPLNDAIEKEEEAESDDTSNSALPEAGSTDTSIPAVKHRTLSINLLNPCTHYKQVFLVVTSRECRKVVLPLLLAFGCSVFALTGELIVGVLYLENNPFDFTSLQLGYYSAVQSAVRGLGVVLVTQVSFHYCKLNDYTLILIGLSSQIVCYVLIGLSRSLLIVFLVNIAGFAAPVATSVLRAAITKQVSKDNYGTVLSSIEATDALGALLTNVVSLWTYDLTITVYSGVVYFGIAGFSLAALVIIMAMFCNQRRGINYELLS